MGEEFQIVEFRVKSGGVPYNLEMVNDYIVSKDYSNGYKTVNNGWSCKYVVSVKCRIIDREKNIYELPNGNQFRWHWRKGSPYTFDRGAFTSPEVESYF